MEGSICPQTPLARLRYQWWPTNYGSRFAEHLLHQSLQESLHFRLNCCTDQCSERNIRHSLHPQCCVDYRPLRKKILTHCRWSWYGNLHAHRQHCRNSDSHKRRWLEITQCRYSYSVLAIPLRLLLQAVLGRYSLDLDIRSLLPQRQSTSCGHVISDAECHQRHLPTSFPKVLDEVRLLCILLLHGR